MPNIPVPAGPRAPITPSWFITHAPFAAVIAAYRLIPAEKRKNWNEGNDYVATSHAGMAAVLRPRELGGGWPAFRHYTMPRFRGRRQPRTYAMAWALFMLSVMLPALRIESFWYNVGVGHGFPVWASGDSSSVSGSPSVKTVSWAN